MGKKIILNFVIILILTSNVYANQGWGMSVMKCSEVLEKKGPKYWDEWILMTSQGLLSGLNVWHLMASTVQRLKRITVHGLNREI